MTRYRKPTAEEHRAMAIHLLRALHSVGRVLAIASECYPKSSPIVRAVVGIHTRVLRLKLNLEEQAGHDGLGFDVMAFYTDDELREQAAALEGGGHDSA